MGEDVRITRGRGNRITGAKGKNADKQELYETEDEKKSREEAEAAEASRVEAVAKTRNAAGGGLGGAARVEANKRAAPQPVEGLPNAKDYPTPEAFDAAMKKWKSRTAADAADALTRRSKP